MTDRCPGSGDRHGVVRSVSHEQPHLMIGHKAAGHDVLALEDHHCDRTAAITTEAERTRGPGPVPSVGLRPPCVTSPNLSHPD